MTADSRRPNGWSGPTPRMRDVSHVHGDHDPRAWHWFARGPILAADGGAPGDARRARSDRASNPDSDRDVENERLRDVSHEPSHGVGANRVWDRGEDDEDDR